MNTKDIKLVLVAAVALINIEGKILLARIPKNKFMEGTWEYPGGKIESNETPETALIREMHEELDISIDPRSLKPLTFVSYSYDDFHLLMSVYVCHTWEGGVKSKEDQELMWVAPPDLYNFVMPPADYPIHEKVIREYF